MRADYGTLCSCTRAYDGWKERMEVHRGQLLKSSLGTLGTTAVAVAATAIGWGVVPPLEAAEACETLLRENLRTPFKTYTLQGLYTIELEPPFQGAPVLLLLPGYTSGSGLWYGCMDHLATRYHVMAVDWLGTGCSDRPPFTETTTAGAESFFFESLEAWRVDRLGGSSSSSSRGGKVTLVGHSLGGYLAAAFALQHPSVVEHLILVNPAGIPASSNTRLAEARQQHWVVGALGKAWDGGVTPGSIIRTLGPLGKGAVEGIVKRRFARLPTPPSPALSDYIHKIVASKGSGEFALPLLLEFGAVAKHPMGPRLLKGAWRGPTTIIHGENDWMPVGESQRLVSELGRQLGVDAAFFTVPRAEHYVFMERPSEFSKLLLKREEGLVKGGSWEERREGGIGGWGDTLLR